MSMTIGEIAALFQESTATEDMNLLVDYDDSRAGPTDKSESIFQKEAGIWQLTFAGKTVYVSNGIGLDYVAYLLANPRRGVGVMSLYRAVATERQECQTAVPLFDIAKKDKGRARKTSSTEETNAVADRSAITECERRLYETINEIEKAEQNKDKARALSLKKVRDELLDYLKACTGHNGHLRRISDVREKTRKSVSNAIARSISKVFAKHRKLARHLRNSIRTGYECTYDPEENIEWSL